MNQTHYRFRTPCGGSRHRLLSRRCCCRSRSLGSRVAQDATPAAGASAAASHQRSRGARLDGEEVTLYTLTNANGMEVKITTYGGIITSVVVPDRDGNMENVTLGFTNLDEYLEGHPYFGQITGRYANRIARGTFHIGDENFYLALNNGPNSLHGGEKGFDKQVWAAEEVSRRRRSWRQAEPCQSGHGRGLSRQSGRRRSPTR